jgi:hypothetical protein
MKKIIAICCLLPTLAFGQGISKYETDKFTKQIRVETYKEPIVGGLTNRLQIGFRGVGDTYFAMFDGTGEWAGTIGPKDAMMLLLDSDSTIAIYPTDVQTYEPYKYGKTFTNHQYEISVDQIQTLRAHAIKSIRIYMSGGYVDENTKEKNQKTAKKLAELFLKTIDKL